MTAPRVLILRAPGTNCDSETAFAFQQAGAQAELFHVNRLLEKSCNLTDFQILCLPGGFSFGDDLAAGRILGNQIRHHLADGLLEFREAGKLILGICNGFQVLMKSGILIDESASESSGGHASNGRADEATLTWNDSGQFEDRWASLVVANDRSVFLRGVQSMYLPVAHAEGRFVTRDATAWDRLEANGQLVLRYGAGQGDPNVELGFPQNPNGSQGNVAGMCDATGRVFGLMPHPERYIDRTQHPRWTRGEGTDPGEGSAIFKNAVEYFA